MKLPSPLLKKLLLVWLMVLIEDTYAQGSLSGTVTFDGKGAEAATVLLVNTPYGAITDSTGNYTIRNIPSGDYALLVSCLGCETLKKPVTITNTSQALDLTLMPDKSLLGEVVITGVSRATLIRENPAAIVSISPKAIERSTESNIIDVLSKHSPGLSTVKTGPNISKPFIRGLGYNRVLTLYDGIRQEGQQWGDEHGIEVDAYNIQRAEVVKGPASLMYGSDALAGVISLFPYLPEEKDSTLHVRLTSEYQGNNGLAGNGLRIGYSSRHLLFSARGSYRLAGNYRNAADGRVYNTGFEEKNASALIGYLTDKGFTHLNLSLYDNLQGIPDGSRDSATRRFTRQIYEGSNDTIKKRPVVPAGALNAYALSPLHQRIQHYRVYSHSSYKIRRSEVDLLLALQQNVRREYTHPTAPEQAGLYLRLNTFNYSLRYNAPKIAGIETSAGFNGMLQDNKSLAATDFPIPDYRLLDAGAYIHLKWKYRKLSLSGGARYDLRLIRWNDFYLRNNPATGFDEHPLSDTNGANLQFSAFKKTLGGLSASAGATYRINDRVSLKANIARGYRAPSITEMASNGLDPGAHIVYLGNRRFVPEFSFQQDLGLSFNYPDISATLSAFNTVIRNYIYLSMYTDGNGNAIVDAQGNKTYRYQQAGAQLYGLEAGFTMHPRRWKGFSFENNLALVQGYNRSAQFKGKGIMGEYLPLIPPLKLSSAVSQSIALRSKKVKAISPKAEVEFSAAQNRYLALNTTETATAGYALLNLGVSADIRYFKNNGLQLQLQVNNVLDKVYQSNLSRLKYFEYYNTAPGSNRGIYNMGRNICIKLILDVG